MFLHIGKPINLYSISDIRYRITNIEVEEMETKNCKIVCDGKEVATIIHSKDGVSFKVTPEGKKLFKDCKCGCCGSFFSGE
jgi:hypothetical protein